MAIEIKRDQLEAGDSERAGRAQDRRRWEGFPPRVVCYLRESGKRGGERQFVLTSGNSFRGSKGRQPDLALWGDVLRRRRRTADPEMRASHSAFRRDADETRQRAGMRAYRSRMEGRRRP